MSKKQLILVIVLLSLLLHFLFFDYTFSRAVVFGGDPYAVFSLELYEYDGNSVGLFILYNEPALVRLGGAFFCNLFGLVLPVLLLAISGIVYWNERKKQQGPVSR